MNTGDEAQNKDKDWREILKSAPSDLLTREEDSLDDLRQNLARKCKLLELYGRVISLQAEEINALESKLTSKLAPSASADQITLSRDESTGNDTNGSYNSSNHKSNLTSTGYATEYSNSDSTGNAKLVSFASADAKPEPEIKSDGEFENVKKKQKNGK